MTGLQPGAYSASTQCASALNALGAGDRRRQAERELGVVDDDLGSTTGPCRSACAARRSARRSASARCPRTWWAPPRSAARGDSASALARPVDDPPPMHTTASAACLGRRRSRPFGELDGDVLRDLVPGCTTTRRRAARRPRRRAALAAPSAIRKTRGRQPLDLVADLAQPRRRRRHHAAGSCVVGERLHARLQRARARRARSSVGGAVTVERPRRTASGHPVARGPARAVTPGCSAVSDELARHGVGPEDAEVGDDDLRSAPPQPEPLAIARRRRRSRSRCGSRSARRRLASSGA